MPGWARIALWVMVVLGIPCAVALWIDFVLGPVRRFVWRRAGRIEAPRDTAGSGPGEAPPPRTSTPRGGER